MSDALDEAIRDLNRMKPTSDVQRQLRSSDHGGEMTISDIFDRREREMYGLKRVPAGRVDPPKEESPRSLVRGFAGSSIFGHHGHGTDRIHAHVGNDRQLFNRAALHHPTLYTVTRRIARAAARVAWDFGPLKGKTQDQSHLLVLRDFIRTPNLMANWGTMILRTVLLLEQVGWAAWEVSYDAAGMPSSYFLLEGTVVEHLDKHGEYRSPALTQKVKNEKVEFEVGEFIIFKNPGPNDELGEKPILPLLDDIAADVNASRWNKRFTQKAPSPEAIAVFDAGLGDAEMRRNREEIKASYLGASEAGVPVMALQGDVDWKQQKPETRDFNFLKGLESHDHRIANVFGFPIRMLTEEEVSPEVKREFMTEAVGPWLSIVAFGINQFIQLINWDKGWEFKFVPPPIADERANARKTDIGGKIGIITVNEARRLIDPSFPDVVNGDEMIVPPALQKAMFEAGLLPDPEPEPGGEGGDGEGAPEPTPEPEPAGVVPEGRDGEGEELVDFFPTGEEVAVPHQHTNDFPEGELCDGEGNPIGQVDPEPHFHTEARPLGVLFGGNTHSDPHVHTDALPCGEKFREEEEQSDHLPKKKKKRRGDNMRRRRQAEDARIESLSEPIANLQAAISHRLDEECLKISKHLNQHRDQFEEETFVAETASIFPERCFTAQWIDALKASWLSGAQHAVAILKEGDPGVPEVHRVPTEPWTNIKNLATERSKECHVYFSKVLVPDLISRVTPEDKGEVVDTLLKQSMVEFEDLHLKKLSRSDVTQAFDLGMKFVYRRHRLDNVPV